MRNLKEIVKYDSPKEIAKCLNCEFPKCINCLGSQIQGKRKPRHSKKVLMYDLDGNFEREFDSISDAARQMKASSTCNLSAAIKRESGRYKEHVYRLKETVKK